LTTLAQRFAHYAGDPGDDPELRKRKSIIVAFLILGVFVCTPTRCSPHR